LFFGGKIHSFTDWTLYLNGGIGYAFTYQPICSITGMAFRQTITNISMYNHCVNSYIELAWSSYGGVVGVAAGVLVDVLELPTQCRKYKNKLMLVLNHMFIPQVRFYAMYRLN